MLPLVNTTETKRFYSLVFGWEFTDFGPNSVSFSGAGIDGSYNGVDKLSINMPGPLVILFADNLKKTQKKIEKAGGIIVKPAYDFPGGRRFHFQDPNGNELAVWSEK